MFANFVNITAIIMSFLTASGILLHDTRIDKAATTAMTNPNPIAILSDSMSTDRVMNWEGHSNEERVSFTQAVRDLEGVTPRLQPRGEEKKHLLPSRVVKGHQPFDNYNLPHL